MGLREQIEETIKKKTAEIKVYEAKLRDARLYVQALQDAINKGQDTKDGVHERRKGKLTNVETSLRVDSAPYKTRELLMVTGHPLHISKILEGIGLTPTDKSSLVSTLAVHVGKHNIFTRTAPNTFGLLEWGEKVDEQPETTE
jgi:hypothetical protein